jgi:vacuolar-type H+-ATPase subunit H
MQDLRSILENLEDKELDFVFERSKTTSAAKALVACGIPESTYYSWPDDKRARLNEYAQQLKRRAKMRAQLVLEDASEDAARKVVELLDSKNPNVALNAAKDVLDRTGGKPSQAHDIDAELRANIVINWANELDNDSDA